MSNRSYIGEWLYRREYTIYVATFLVFWYLLEYLIIVHTGLSTYFEFYTWTKGDQNMIGLLLAPISHNIFQDTHVLKNVIYFVFASSLVEPHLKNKSKIPIIFIASGITVYALTNILSGPTGFESVFIGSSCSVFTFWTYGGVKTYYSLKESSPLFKTQTSFKFQKYVALSFIGLGFIVGVYELALTNHLCHYLSVLMGFIIIMIEEHIDI